MRHSHPYILFLLMLCLLAGCKMGPNYTRSEDLPVPADYRQDFPENTNIADIPYWQLFGDTVLVRLIETSLDNNQDLKLAAARIREAAASVGVVRANLYPRVNYGADASLDITTTSETFSSSFSPVASVSYIVDLWGRIRRLNEAANQEFLATGEAYRALTILLVSEVANAYLLLRDLDNRLIIAEQTADTWRENLNIVRARFDGGFVSEVDLNQARIQLTEALTAIQTFERLRVQTENTLSILMGVPPQDIPRGLALQEQLFAPVLPAGLPSELLDRRPDVRAAELRLAAQTARIGAAEALKYPSLTLTADMGAQFANPTVGFASLGAQVLGPIFNSGAIREGVEIERARTEQLLNDYEFTFLNAVREVEDAMVALETYDNEVELRNEQVAAAQEAANLSWVRYDGGLTSYLEVLDLQRSSFNSQLRASEALRLQLTSAVSLYQALGGGWVAEQDSLIIEILEE